MQLAWIGFLWLPGVLQAAGLVVLIVAELAVPAWAEFRGEATNWHPEHIVERYGSFTIIVLGVVIIAVTAAIQTSIAAGGLTSGLLVTAAAGLVLVFALWWSYFKHSAAEHLRLSQRRAMAWGYGHFLIFAAVAALGAGLQVVIDTLNNTGQVSQLFAALTVAIPVAVFLLVLGALGRTGGERLVSLPSVTLTAALVVLTAWAVQVASLPLTLTAMALLVVLLLIYQLAVSRFKRSVTADP